MSGIRDLARHLNISIGTVSRALNGRADVNAETRRRVLAAAAELNYAPNQSGRSLRKGATHSVAFMLQPHSGSYYFGEPFFMPFMVGLQAGLAESGFDLIAVVGAPGDYQMERLRRVVEARLADAVILAWTRRDDERIDYLSGLGFPFATLGRSRSGGTAYPSLDLDFEKAAVEAVDRLVAAGHRRIAAVGPSADLNFGHLFRAGYRRGLRRHGLELDKNLTADGELSDAGGYSVVAPMMRQSDPPTAIIFNNDGMALGGRRVLDEMGLRPGRDVAIIVMVDTPLCTYFSPALTSFRVALEPLGKRLAGILVSALPRFAATSTPRFTPEIVPMEFVQRESDGPPADLGRKAAAARKSPRERKSNGAPTRLHAESSRR